MNQTQPDFFGYLDILFRRKWVFILCVMIGTAVAVFIAYISPAYYRSTTFILVEQQKIPAAYVTPTDSTPFEQRLSTIQQQVMSRTNLEKIINDFHLYGEDGKRQESGPIGKLKSIIWKEVETKPAMESIVERMRKDIEIEVSGGNRRNVGEAFRISYVGVEPEITMQVTSTLASLFIDENLKIKEQYAEGTSKFLVKELEKAKKDLTAQEAAIRKFKERRMGALPEQLDANLRTLDRLQLELQSVSESLRNSHDRRALLEEQINRLSSGATLSGATTTQPGTVQPGTARRGNTLKEELAGLKRELATLLSMYKENYPDVIVARSRIKELEEQIASPTPDDAEGGAAEQSVDSPPDQTSDTYASLSEVKSQIASLKEREARIRAQIAARAKRVEDTPANEQKLAGITRDYEITRQNYQTLLEKKLNAKLAQNLEKRQKGARFRVVDPANFPERPFKPNRQMIVLFGVVGGAGAGIGFVLLLEFLNPAFRKPEDFIGVLDQPVLVSIPVFAVSRKNGSASRSKVSNKKRRGVEK
ncbi:MAG: GumC family protein [Nitrospinota bacterium]